MPDRRRRLHRDTQSVALLLTTICLILATSVVVGGLLAIASLLAGAIAAAIHERLRT